MSTNPLARREFLKLSAAAAAGTMLTETRAGAADEPAPTSQPDSGQLIWANLLHLSYNMWCDWDAPSYQGRHSVRRPDLRFDESLWNDLLQRMVDVGMNMVVIDLGDGVVWRSHPEIAVRNAWSTDRLKKEVARLRDLGLEPIPKLNFSATHDDWLGPYARMLSTEPYYSVCRDLIAEAIELFDKPRFFHLGMDEETERHQRDFQYVVIRQFDLWWHDFLFLVEQTVKGGSRPWIWSDYAWDHPEEFYQRMPKSVLQSNWYYSTKFGDEVKAVKTYRDLDAHGYDQIPTGSNWTSPDNFGMTVDYCRKHIAPRRLFGFLQTPWQPTLEVCRKQHIAAVEQVGQAIVKWKAGS